MKTSLHVIMVDASFVAALNVSLTINIYVIPFSFLIISLSYNKLLIVFHDAPLKLTHSFDSYLKLIVSCNGPGAKRTLYT